MTDKQKVQPGDIVQIAPDASGGVERFGACLVIVTEARNWGVQGYVKNAGSSGQAYIRLQWQDFEVTGGRAEWTTP